MSSPDDRPAATGEPVPPQWDAPPQPPAWDRPVGGQQDWGPPPAYAAQPGYGGYGAPTQTDGKAVAGLVLAICSWVVLPIIAAIVALVLAGSSQREIAASGGRLGGQGLNTATKWVSWINIVVFGLGILLFLGAVVLFASAGFS
jgi:hypothetical protein